MKSQSTKSSRNIIIAIAGIVISSLGLLTSLFNEGLPKWVPVIAGIVLFVCVCLIVNKWLVSVFRLLHPRMELVSPWLVLAILVLTLFIFFFVKPTKEMCKIRFDRSKGAIFNSWLDAPHDKHIISWGVEAGNLDWVIADEGRVGNFQYRANPDIPESKGASSGGYVTFYGEPVDRLKYRILCLRCKATGVNGIPDVGLRLVVEAPAGDKELVTYELYSLRAIGPINANWRAFKIHLSDFRHVRYERPLPKYLDENTITKMVFFVDNRIVRECPEGTLWFSDIEFHQD